MLAHGGGRGSRYVLAGLAVTFIASPAAAAASDVIVCSDLRRIRCTIVDHRRATAPHRVERHRDERTHGWTRVCKIALSSREPAPAPGPQAWSPRTPQAATAAVTDPTSGATIADVAVLHAAGYIRRLFKVWQSCVRGRLEHDR
jgi:hypothetical protein